MTETRPANCRFRLQDEGKAYPRSACTACGKSITTGLGTHCTVTDTSGREKVLEDALRPFANVDPAQVKYGIWHHHDEISLPILFAEDFARAKDALASPSTQEPALRGGRVEDVLYFPLNKAQEIALACANELMQVGPQICLFPRSRSEAIIASHIAAALRTHAGESAAQSERSALERAERIVRNCLIEAPTHAEDEVIERACAALSAARKAGGE